MNETLMNAMVPIVVAVVTVVGGMLVQALHRLATKWELQGTAQDQANMEAQIKTAINVGVTSFLPLIKANGWDSPTVRTAVLAKATEYLAQRFPDRTQQIVAADAGSTGVSDVRAVQETIAARMPEAMAHAAASPATPPVEPPALPESTPVPAIPEPPRTMATG